MAKTFLDTAYDLTSPDKTVAHYDEWSETYDEELTSNGYATPQRCAEALARFADPKTPVLDFGCGTGLSGVALKAAGFQQIDGRDVSAEMLSKAAARGVYRQTSLVEPGAAVPEGYHAIAAIGVIGVGAAPLGVMGQIAAALPSGGKMVFSLNDHALADPSYTHEIERLIADVPLRMLFQEHGDHIPGIDLKSTVYVLEKK